MHQTDILRLDRDLLHSVVTLIATHRNSVRNVRRYHAQRYSSNAGVC